MQTNERKKIFITGGSGFIGRNLINEFKNSNYDLYVLTRNRDIHTESSNLTPIYGDLLEINKLSNIIASCDYVIHMAGEKRNEPLMPRVNIDGTCAILNEIVKYPYIKLIHLSSAGVYGIRIHPDKIISEDSECFPNNEYEISKLKAEKSIINFSQRHPIKYTILRPSNVFGEFDKGKKLLNLFKSIQRNRFVFLSSTASVNYVYVRYLTRVIFELINQDIFENEVYNINSPCNIFDFVEFIKKLVNNNNITLQIPKYIIYPIAKISDYMPPRFQLINSTKYFELTNLKTYSNKKIMDKHNSGEDCMLFEGLNNLFLYYKKEGYL